MQERMFGRLQHHDERNGLYPIAQMLGEPPPPELRQMYWNADGWWGDQGATTECTAYSWTHFIQDGPVIQNGYPNEPVPMIPPDVLYAQAQLRDPWPGTNYSGCTVGAVARVLKDLGVIKEYRWATNITDVINTLLMIGPMVVGTQWYDTMMRPDENGLLNINGKDVGGHAYLLDGVDLDKHLVRVKNSWSKNWGKSGFGFINIDDFEKLLANGGEACVAFENVITEAVDWSKLEAPGIYTDTQ